MRHQNVWEELQFTIIKKDFSNQFENTPDI